MTVFEVISTAIRYGIRYVKHYGFGKSDVRDRVEVSPWGIDSAPVEKTRGVSSSTARKGQSVVIGYVNTNQSANPGEFRTYATDANGDQVFYTYMKNDGTMEIGGDSDHMARFSELKSGFDALKSDFNSFVSTYNGHTHSVPQAPSGSTTSATTTSSGSSSSASIDSAKINEIKTI